MRKRNLKINIFLSPEENKIFEDKAKKSGLNKSEFFRKVTLDYQLKEQPDERFELLMKQLAERENITEELKATNQLEWVGRMNNIKHFAEEIILKELIYV